jgi:hypothetical protein
MIAVRALQSIADAQVHGMDLLDPVDAQQVVIEYARVLERDVTEHRHPARVDSLPYAKPVIKSAIRTSAQYLAVSGQLTGELREYLETAYTSLAEYLEGELVELMTQYRRSAEALEAESPSAHEKTRTAAWRTLAESSSLAAEVARTATVEVERLRTEFRSFLASA